MDRIEREQQKKKKERMKDKERRNRDLAPLMACSEHRRRKEFLNQEGTDKKKR
jgi:hypothetical protein